MSYAFKNMNKKLAIILDYYNGEKYINELIRSIFLQTYKNFHIFIFDDKSINPLKINDLKINSYERKKISIKRRKKNLGYSKNFLKGLEELDSSFDYYSFCDQDDIWLPNKLSNGIKILEKVSSNQPCLYGTASYITDQFCKQIIDSSMPIRKPLTFKNSILQSYSGGNTMIFNKKAKNEIIKNLDLINPISHDWWSYMIVSGIGGEVIYNSEPSIMYRQHNHNLVGTNKSLKGKIKRIVSLIKGDFRIYLNRNLKSLIKQKNNLTKENQLFLEECIESRNSNFFKRIFFYLSSGIYRQNKIGNLIFFVFFIFKKI